jgi:ABC-type lipoprotein release transport system permease subunit
MNPPAAEELSLGAYGYILSQARANPTRTGATITAVAVAVTFLIIVSGISVGLEGAQERELLDYTVGTPELPISDFIQTEEGDFIGLFATRLLDVEEVNSMRLEAQQFMGSASDVRVYPYSERVLGQGHYSGLEYTYSRLMAIDPQLGVTTPYTSYSPASTLARGEHLGDVGAREVVLGYGLWEERYADARVGETIDLTPQGVTWFEADAAELRAGGPIQVERLDGVRGLTLVGVLDRNLGTDDNAYVPLGMFATETGAGSTDHGPRCEAVSVEVRRTGAAVGALADRLEAKSGRVSSYFVTTAGRSTSQELAEDLRSSIYSWLVLAVAVILVAMVLGVANTTYLSVSQRVREIGTLRALGLTREQVHRLVQWEALFLGMMGGVIGFFAGHIIASSVLNELFEIEGLGLLLAPGRTVPVVVLASLLAVLLASLLGAAIPARRAADLSPVEALSAPR